MNVLSSVHCAIPSVCFGETGLLPALLEAISPFLPAVSSVLLLDPDGPNKNNTKNWTLNMEKWTSTNYFYLVLQPDSVLDGLNYAPPVVSILN